MVIEPEEMSVTVCGKEEREVVWAEDLYRSILHAHRTSPSVQPGSAVCVKCPAVALIVSSALEFCWARTVTLGKRTFKQWSSLRGVIQDMYRNAREAEGSFEGMGTDAIVENLLGELGPDDEETPAKRVAAPSFLRDDAGRKEFELWVQHNPPGMPMDLHQAWQELMGKVHQGCPCTGFLPAEGCALHGCPVKLDELVMFVSSHIFQVLPGEYVTCFAWATGCVQDMNTQAAAAPLHQSALWVGCSFTFTILHQSALWAGCLCHPCINRPSGLLVPPCINRPSGLDASIWGNCVFSRRHASCRRT